MLQVEQLLKQWAPARYITTPLSYGYRALVQLRHRFYDKGKWTKQLAIPVISVGNIVAGGTGKTPFVHYLTTQLKDKKMAILSRGYRRKGTGIHRVTASSTVDECGDEPYLLAKKNPQTLVIVGKNRYQTGQMAQKLGAECILLDDGMQHRKLHRDLDLVVMNPDDLFGGGYFLPRGYLRENPYRLRQADCIILNGIETKSAYENACNILQTYTSAPIIAMGWQYASKEAFFGKKVGGFCAIGSPQKFWRSLEILGSTLVIKKEKPDHFSFYAKELTEMAEQAKKQGATLLVCTEKDWVKYPHGLELSLPVIPLALTLYPTFGQEQLETIIKRLIP